MSNLTDEQVQVLNEWARTEPALRRAFPYTKASNVDTLGLGTALDSDNASSIAVKESDGTPPEFDTDTVTFDSEYFYLTPDSAGKPVVSFRPTVVTVITDHGDLDGLGDDDHPQYLLRTEIPPGFYGIVIKESDGSYVTRDDTIVFTSADFNVADGVDGKPTVTIVDSGIDHGGLGGLADDDHTQYLLIDGTRAMTGVLQIVDGSAVSPGLQFDADPNTGIYRAGANQMILTADGQDVLQVNSVIGSSQVQLLESSSAGIPALAGGASDAGFGGLGNTGLFFNSFFGGDNSNPFMGVSVAGTEVAKFGPDGVRVADKVIAEAFYLAQGGDVFAYSFNRDHFYVTPAKSNIGRKVVNLDVEPGSIDHGGLGGLGDDDHPQYALTDGSRDITGHQDFLNGVRVAGKVVGEAFYTNRLSISDDGTSVYVEAATAGTGALNIRADRHVNITSGLTGIGSVTLSAQNSVVASAVTGLSFAAASGDVTFNAGDDVIFIAANETEFFRLGQVNPDLSLGKDGARFSDKVEAEAFYLTQGGDVFAYDFNRDHFYVTPSKVNIGRKVVNLDIDPGSVDHGGLGGLLDDDHTQYAFTDGSRDITGHQDFLNGVRAAGKVEAEAFYTTSFGEVFPSPYRKHIFDKSFTNTAAEQDVFNDTIPGGALGSDRVLTVKLRGNIRNFSGVNRTYTFNVYWGGTARVSYLTPVISSIDTNRMWDVDLRLAATGSPNSQFISGYKRIVGLNPVGATGLGASVGVDQVFGIKDDVGVDSSQDQQFRLTVTPSVANAAYSFYLYDLEVEIR